MRSPDCSRPTARLRPGGNQAGKARTDAFWTTRTSATRPGRKTASVSATGARSLEAQERAAGCRERRSEERGPRGAARGDREGDRDSSPAVEDGDERRRAELGEDEALRLEGPGLEHGGVLEIAAQVDPEAERRQEGEERGHRRGTWRFAIAAAASAEGASRRAEPRRARRQRGHDRRPGGRGSSVFQARRFFHTIAISGRPRGARANGTRPRRLLGREGLDAARGAAGRHRGAAGGLGERRLLEADGGPGDPGVEEGDEAERGGQRDAGTPERRREERARESSGTERGARREGRRRARTGARRPSASRDGSEPLPEAGPLRRAGPPRGSRGESRAHRQPRRTRPICAARRAAVGSSCQRAFVKASGEVVEVDRGQEQPEPGAGQESRRRPRGGPRRP